MDKQQIINRMDELAQAARLRIPPAPNVICAEVFWMTDEELSEFHELRRALPSPGQEREDAKHRISKRISERKSRKANG